MPDTSPIEFGPIERWVKARIARGTARFVMTSTIPISLASAALTAVPITAFDRWEDLDFWGPALISAALIPSILAPMVLLYFARMVQLLDYAAQELRTAAETDPLTGAKNRRGFFAAVGEFESRNEPLIMTMVDLDDFKGVNDVHGHDFGDQALALVADWLQEFVGAQGVVGRLGGDEFACVSNATIADAPTRQAFVLGEVGFSISIGQATHAESAAEALLQADAALYRHKQQRREHRAT